MSILKKLKQTFPNRENFYVLEIPAEARRWTMENRRRIAISFLANEGKKNPTESEIASKQQSILDGLLTEYALNALAGTECLQKWKDRSLSGNHDDGYDHPAGFFTKTWDAKTSNFNEEGIKPLGDYSLCAPVGLKADLYPQFICFPSSPNRFLVGFATKDDLKNVGPSKLFERQTYEKRHLKFQELRAPDADLVKMLKLQEYKEPVEEKK